ncbi:hypothetical protein ACWFNE_14085 [Cellulomonas sp. NPDC055163]
MTSVHLQDGFDDDEVVLLLDGTEVRSSPHVTTRLLLGYAEIVRLENTAPSARLRVEVPGRGLSAEVVVDPETVVTVAVEPGGLVVRTGREPLGYV